MADKKLTLKKLPDGPEIVLTADLTVGRAAENDLRLVEGSPSRRHALISVGAEGVAVQDLGSTNGTFVNDKRIDGQVKLNSNDRVRFDVEEYLFKAESTVPPGDMTVRRAATPAVVVADSGHVKVPAGWVDNAPSAGGNKTQFMTPEQMAQERQRAQAAASGVAAMGRVETPLLLVPGDPDGAMRVQLRATSTDKKEWTVGSEGEREILIKRPGVSALHAKIVNDGNRWKVIDQLSANGTFVNGKRCNVSFLASGDRISFGGVECTFQLPSGGAAAAAGPAAGGGGAGISRILVIAAVSFIVTLVVLYLVLRKLGWL
jgi:pSer/pThr/pTyr-binding forkhead associated (FHA) protein